MGLGRTIRLSRIFPHGDGRYFGMALDHAIGRGIAPGLDTIEKTIAAVVDGKPDALTIHKGIAEGVFSKHAGSVPLIIKLSAFTYYQQDVDVQLTTVSEAVRMGADAVAIGCMLCGPEQPQQLAMLGKAVKDAHDAGMPIFAHVYPKGSYLEPDEHTRAENVAYAVRCAGELGVDLVKTNYTGDPDSFAKVVQQAATKVAVAGGTPGKDLRSYLQMAHDVISVGGAGVTLGRFVIAYRNPSALIRAISALVHDNLSVDQALEYLRDLEEGR